MKYPEIQSVVAGTPFIGSEESRILYEFILRERPARCLELGHAHGASSLYIAGALAELGEGHLDTVDLDTSRDREPNIETLLERAGLEEYATVHREKNSYNWFLKKRIEELSNGGSCEPCFDFCYIDGPKNWTIDGLAFFLVDKLLREDGWILFDDYGWTHAGRRHRSATDGITVRSLSEEEVVEPHIARVFHLLVMQHPSFSNFEVQDDWWAWAQKSATGSRRLRRSSRAAALARQLGEGHVPGSQAPDRPQSPNAKRT